MARTAKKFFADYDIQYIQFDSMPWNIEDDSCIFSSGELLGFVNKIQAKNVRICMYHWNTDIAWHVLYKRKRFKKLASLLYETNACSFMDYGCYIYACRTFYKHFEKNYIPLFFYSENYKKYNYINKKNEINIVWLGRLSTSKTLSLINAIENFSEYKTKKKKIFHIIGNGLDEDALKDFCKTYEKDITFIFTGVLTGDDLNKYLQENTDVGLAMGTSLLNFAALHLPVIAAQEPRERFHSNKFQWLFNLFEYCLGSPLEEGEDFEPMFKSISTFKDMLDDISIHNKRIEYGEKCYKYYIEKHSNIEMIGKKFVECIKKTKLTYEKYKKCLKYIPYNSIYGIGEKKYYFFNIPFIKIIYHGHETFIYLFGIRFAKIIDWPDQKKIYFCGFKIMRCRIYGKYYFPTLTSPTIKEQCKNKFAIEKRIFNKF